AVRVGMGKGTKLMASSGKRLRELIQAPEILVLPGAWYGLSAILIEQAGFQGVYVKRAAIFGMRRLLQELRETRTGEFFAETVGFQERESLSNSDYYFQLQEHYLRLD